MIADQDFQRMCPACRNEAPHVTACSICHGLGRVRYRSTPSGVLEVVALDAVEPPSLDGPSSLPEDDPEC